MGDISVFIQDLFLQFGTERTILLPILQGVKQKFGIITFEMIQEIAIGMNLSPVDVEGVASFYQFLGVNQKSGKHVIRVCQSLSCRFAGAENVIEHLEKKLQLNEKGITPDEMFSLERVNCLGLCDQGPALLVDDSLYNCVTKDRIEEIIGEADKRNLSGFHPSFVRIKGNLLNHNTSSPEPLRKTIGLSTSEVLDELKKSGLRGRGGAGFPTEIKWETVAEGEGDKWIVCNADEGEPGTFKDRYLLMDQPDLVFEGMTIAGYVTGAHKGFVYLRGEYEYIRKYLQETIEGRIERNLLGKNIYGIEGFDFTIEIRMGSGAYICGEESALIESLEGKRGEPRNRPPFPASSGYLGHPTLVNNVETFVNVSLILDRGAQWFHEKGTAQSTGTKLFSVSGDCTLPGIYELPFGITINDLLQQCGGGQAAAVQVGGPSGKLVLKEEFSHHLAYEDIPTGGSVIVIGKERDLNEVAVEFMRFFTEESCGQCVPCREGNPILLEGIHKIKNGSTLDFSEMEKLTSLAETMKLTSKCGLGQTSPNVWFTNVLRQKNGK